jgi:acetylornithine/succinyldiaminopimelate/putrescine aminotransferase
MEKVVYVPSDQSGIRVAPPLVVTRDELEWVCAAIDDALGLADVSLANPSSPTPYSRSSTPDR